MKKFAFAAIVAPLALAACAQEESAAEEMGQEVQDNDVKVVPPVQAEAPMNETSGATSQGSNLSVEGADVKATISEDGVQAEVDLDE